MTGSASLNSVEQKLLAISEISREDLAGEWIKIYKCPPPKSIKRGLLERAAAYRLQTRRFGKLKPETHKALQAMAGDQPVQRQCNTDPHAPNI